MENFSLIVEGKEDTRFLQDFIFHHYKRKIDRNIFIEVGGKSETLHLSTVKIQTTSENNTTVLLFDADDNDFASTIRTIKSTATKLNLRFDHIFLFPNNGSGGNLESLLKSSVADGNERLFACIDDYAKCRDAINLQNPRVITEKEKLVIYHGSFEESGNAKATERSYLNTSIWNLNSPSLEPLKEFLATFFA
ncbi:MAG: hypothetical protein HOP30_04175 [Cyclobacteriaceae bacterium]|nr:hypothetical protein [Cyclobacteriaceae bacterium]